MSSFSKQVIKTQVLQAIDGLLVLLGFWLAYLFRDPVMDLLNSVLRYVGYGMFKQSLGSISDIFSFLVVVVPMTPLVLERIGFYRDPIRGSMVKALARILTSVFVMVCAVAMLSLFLKLNSSSRAVLILAAFTIALLLWGRFLLMRSYWRHRNRRQKIRESIVLAGKPEEIEKLLSSLEQDDSTRWRVVGSYDLASEKWGDFQKLLHDEAVERVIFAAKHSEFDKIATAVEMCEVRGIEAWISANFMQTQVARPSFDSIQGNPMLVLSSTPELSWELLCKGLMDRVGSFIAILVSLPFWFVVAVLIKLQSPGPVFYKQERAGRYGKPFWMWKFRTMIVDADKKLEELKQQAGNQMSGPVFKLENDPRIFPLGRLLRKFSIDEFPQFINVLLGDMSLVGPRPMAMYELPHIERSEHRRKLSVRPGLTCIWQVSGRNQITSFEEWVDLDLKYIDNWSLWLDIKLLVMTIPAVLFAKGAK
jgi:exopolysaccharide biosynthesis polyprenyl glycosylphosphotransferase